MSFENPIDFPHEGRLFLCKLSADEKAQAQTAFRQAMEMMGKHYCVLFDPDKLVGEWFVNPEAGRAWARAAKAEFSDANLQDYSRRSTTELEDLAWGQKVFKAYQDGSLLRLLRDDKNFLRECGIDAEAS